MLAVRVTIIPRTGDAVAFITNYRGNIQHLIFQRPEQDRQTITLTSCIEIDLNIDNISDKIYLVCTTLIPTVIHINYTITINLLFNRVSKYVNILHPSGEIISKIHILSPHFHLYYRFLCSGIINVEKRKGNVLILMNDRSPT